MDADTDDRRQACSADYQLRFRSLFVEGRGCAFPCDVRGHVDMDHMSRAALDNYLYARTVIGREFYLPVVERVPH